MATHDALKTIEILLVEDSPTDRLLAIDALEQSGLINTLHCVDNGVDAMRYLRREGQFETAKRPDLVLLDLNLPKKSGHDVLAEIKADPSLKYIPVIVLTTSRSDSDLLEAYGHHANGYITKPLDFASFSAALKTLGGYWFNVVTLPPGPSIERLRPESEAAFADEPRHHVRAALVSQSPKLETVIRELTGDCSPLTFEFTRVDSLASATPSLRLHKVDLLLLDLVGSAAASDAALAALCQQARRLARAVTVIALVTEDAKGEQALHNGVDDYLVLGDLDCKVLKRASRYALERQQYRQQQDQARRLEAVGQLVAGVAHDFNNLLSIAKGSTDLLLVQDPERADRIELLQNVSDATERARVLARQLLTLSRQRPLEQQHLDLNHVVSQFVRFFGRVVDHRIKLELHQAPRMLPILADPGMLDRVLLNLALNARDAMAEGGTICIECAAVAIDEARASGRPGAYAGTFASLTISDTGIGMSEEVLTRAFAPFFTTKADGGTGLGLATVASIVEQHEGWLEVTSRRGEGTRFQVFLPSTWDGPAA